MRTVMWRMIEADGVQTVMPAQELERTAHHVALLVPVGAPGVTAVGERGGPRGGFLIPGSWTGGYRSRPWRGKDLVAVHRFGDDWSCWRWLNPDGSGWEPGTYVNLEEDWRPTPLGYDSADLTLDVVVAADGSMVLKDVDELDWAEAEGHYSPERAAWIRSVGDRAASHVRAGGWPMPEDWDGWRVDRPPLSLSAVPERALRLACDDEQGR